MSSTSLRFCALHPTRPRFDEQARRVEVSTWQDSRCSRQRVSTEVVGPDRLRKLWVLGALSALDQSIRFKKFAKTLLQLHRGRQQAQAVRTDRTSRRTGHFKKNWALKPQDIILPVRPRCSFRHQDSLSSTSIYRCVCMHVRMCVCIYTHIRTYTYYVCMYVRTHVCAYAYMHIRMYVRIHVYMYVM